MTLADMGRTKLTLHGPSPLAHYVSTMRTYARRDELEVQVNEVQSASDPKLSAPLFKDANVTVQAIVLSPDTATSDANAHKRRRLSPSATPSRRSKSPPASRETAQDVVRAIYSGKAGGRRRDAFLPLPPLPPHDAPHDGAPAKALCFIVEHPAQRGKFDNDRATHLGVPLGRARGTLVKNGSLSVMRPMSWSEWDAVRKTQWLKEQEKKGKDEQRKRELEKKKKKDEAKNKKGENTRKEDDVEQTQPQSQAPVVEELQEVSVKLEEVTGPERLGSVSSVR